MRSDDRKGKAPDERMADHTRELCKIAKRGIDNPVDGVRRTFRYYGDHGPNMAHDFADLLVLIERIDDDEAHDRRAVQARRTMERPAIECAATFDRFGRAIENSPEAQAIIERNFERFSRTLEILFGEGAAWLPMPGQAPRVGTLLDAVRASPR
jgi:hypothetical protein